LVGQQPSAATASARARPGPGSRPVPSLPVGPRPAAASPASKPLSVDGATQAPGRPHRTPPTPAVKAQPGPAWSHRSRRAGPGRDGTDATGRTVGHQTAGRRTGGHQTAGQVDPGRRSQVTGRPPVGHRTAGRRTAGHLDPGRRTGLGGHPSGHRPEMDSRQASWHPTTATRTLPLACCPEAPPGCRRQGRSVTARGSSSTPLDGSDVRKQQGSPHPPLQPQFLFVQVSIRPRRVSEKDKPGGVQPHGVLVGGWSWMAARAAIPATLGPGTADQPADDHDHAGAGGRRSRDAAGPSGGDDAPPPGFLRGDPAPGIAMT
jgi:hypothetical protein